MLSKPFGILSIVLIIIIGTLTVYFAITQTQEKGAEANWEGCSCVCRLQNEKLVCTYDGIACPGYLNNTSCTP